MDKFANFFQSGSVTVDSRIGTQRKGLFIYLLIILSVDIITNPGPFIAQQNHTDCLSILPLNTRSIRHKLDFIKDNFLDFDVLCFSETHLTNDITNDLWDSRASYPRAEKITRHLQAVFLFILLTNLSQNVEQT